MLNIDEADPKVLKKLANYVMPFGKYKGQKLLYIPEEYFLWFNKQGLPNGELGIYMHMMMELKMENLAELLKPLENQ
jgi:uncharacterized protein (DUF3820 family)|tara:strand:+ start:1906 stop:2136 length:231 start_codon:yes stop_codon:yes gene_type:complete